MTDNLSAVMAALADAKSGNVVSMLYDAYIEGESILQTEHEADVAEIGGQLDGIADGLLLGAYEEAARRAGFYAGFKAAVNIFN